MMTRPDWPHLYDYAVMHDLAAHLAAVRARDIPALVADGKLSAGQANARIGVAEALRMLWAAVIARQPIPKLAVDDFAIATDLADACTRPDPVKARWQATWGADYPKALEALAWHAAAWHDAPPHPGMMSRVRLMHGLTQDIKARAKLIEVASAPNPMKVAA